MGIKNLFSYQVRAARYRKVYNRESNSIVVFLHGILSNCDSAFKMTNGQFFWDMLAQRPPFTSFDLATFDYGFLDISKLTELSNPYNSLEVLTNELHGALLGYDHVILVGHSQGGLLAREYVCKYHGHSHPCVLVTLHSPHKNRSFYVKRMKNPLQWPEKYSFRVPHIVAGSINDRYFAKIDNIAPYARYDSYISKDSSKQYLGHGHLSQSPDSALLDKMSRLANDFIRSGFTRMGYNPYTQSLETGQFFYSKSKRRLEEFENNYRGILKNVESSNAWASSKKLTINACSVSNIVRNMVYEQKLEPTVVDLDYFFDENLTTANDRLCLVNLSSNNSANPYADIPFDISQFKKRSLITNPDFLLMLNENCKKRGITIRKSFGIKADDKVSSERASLMECYLDTIKQMRKDLTSDIYNQFNTSATPKRVGAAGFENYLFDVISKIKSLKGNHHQYVIIYELMFKLGNQKGYQFVLEHIEKIIAKIARSDGELYWLDRDISFLFDNEVDALAVF
ncbi:esterase/lipase family protein [Vibrio diazotrophicus]|uniref:esterase/lipase family protein n=1 Tax=Vibrio diazotrophicus TaxID=685 RepID=UPI000C9E8CCB|nr:alpha/beta fold hydrolase [Vibrio diazotrophicus]PNH94731.1 hypothetical protein C1M59_01450 [Vibrio diazotrophicus]USN27068.1 hypothetical protein [synthetic construct]